MMRIAFVFSLLLVGKSHAWKSSFAHPRLLPGGRAPPLSITRQVRLLREPPSSQPQQLHLRATANPEESSDPALGGLPQIPKSGERGGEIEPEEAPRERKKKSLAEKARAAGPAGALAYLSINLVWYLVGVALVSRGRPVTDATLAAVAAAAGGEGAPGQGLWLVATKRIGAAWGLVFAASQVTAALRGGLAVAMSTVTAPVIATVDRRLGHCGRWRATGYLAGGLAVAFLAGLGAIFLADVVRIAAALEYAQSSGAAVCSASAIASGRPC